MRVYPEKRLSGQKRDAQTDAKKMGISDNAKRKGPYRGVITATAVALIIVAALIFLSGFSRETGNARSALSQLAWNALEGPDIGSPS